MPPKTKAKAVRPAPKADYTGNIPLTVRVTPKMYAGLTKLFKKSGLLSEQDAIRVSVADMLTKQGIPF